MFDAISKAAAWDPLGVVTEAEPSSFTDRLKMELKLLRAGVRAVVEGAQGIPMTRADDSAALVASLKEVMLEHRDEVDTAQREIRNLQKTISMLQEERRRYSLEQPSPSQKAAAPTAAPPPPPEPSTPPAERARRDADASAARTAAAVEQAVAAARLEERARAEEARSAAEAAHGAKLAAALKAERDDARVRLAAVERRAAADAEASIFALTLCTRHSLVEVENELRSNLEAHTTALQQTKQRAAAMLAKKDAALAAARRAPNARESARDSTAPAASGGTAPGTRSLGIGTSDGGGGECSADSTEALLAAATALANGGGVGGGGGAALASRFARRVAELEGALSRSRESNRALEATNAEEERKRKALRARLQRQEKGGGETGEYLRNVLLRWFCLPVAERASLFPAIAAACAFTKAELSQIEAARASHAGGAGAWLFGRRDDTYADAPPGTPLSAAPPHRTPATDAAARSAAAPRGGGAADERQALRDKVSKLRWLLWQANQEILRLKGAPAPPPPP